MSEQANPTPKPSKPIQPAGNKKRVTLEMPKDLPVFYSNATVIDFSPAEVVVDFVQLLPRMPKALVKSRIILSPIHAKILQRALAQHVENFERRFGVIRMPTQSVLADDFFRSSGKGDDDKGK